MTTETVADAPIRRGQPRPSGRHRPALGLAHPGLAGHDREPGRSRWPMAAPSAWRGWVVSLLLFELGIALGHPAGDLRLLPGGPLVAAGLYEASRLREQGRSPTLADHAGPFRRNGAQIAFIGAVLLLLHLFWVRIAGLIFMLFFGMSGIRQPGAAARCDAAIRPAAALPGHRHRLRLRPRRRQLRGLGGVHPDAGGPRHLGAGGGHRQHPGGAWRIGGRCCSGPG